jgi:hypothetical protein
MAAFPVSKSSSAFDYRYGIAFAYSHCNAVTRDHSAACADSNANA